MVADDITAIFDAIVAERRLTGVAHLAVARSMAMMLAQSEPDVRGISSLALLLPPAPVDASDAKYDVAILGGDEFRLLEYLLRCATPGGEKPEPPRDLLAAYSRNYSPPRAARARNGAAARRDRGARRVRAGADACRSTRRSTTGRTISSG